MTSFSSSLIRHPYTPFISTVLHRYPSKFPSLSIATCRNQISKHHHHLLKARDTVKYLTSLWPSLTSDDKLHLMPDQAIGKVASVQADLMRVVIKVEKSENYKEGYGFELLCVVRILLKKIERNVLVGDKVIVGSIDWINRRGRIEDVINRKTEIHQPPVANVDHLLVLFSLDQPKLEEFLLTMFLVEAESNRIPVTLALNKAELVDKQTIMSWKSKLHSWGYEPIFCSAVTKAGLDTLQLKLRDRTSVIVGPSGVGKSCLINALRSNHCGFAPTTDSILGSKWFEDQRVGEVSARIGRGKNTTSHVSLLPLSSGGYVADTSGFSDPKKLELLKVTQKCLALCFPEVRNILSASDPMKCEFSDCLHIGEPGCLVKTDWERHLYYIQLLHKIENGEEKPGTKRAKREGDVRYKGGKPQLQPKKLRRTSRKKMNQSLLDDVEFDERFFRR